MRPKKSLSIDPAPPRAFGILNPMWIKCLTCEALARPVYLAAAFSPHTVDIELLRRGLHNQPPNLRARLQAAIDACEGQPFQAVALAYGLCGKALEGLQARSIPLVIPRAHDCITLYLGSRARYQEQFEQFPGTYWYSQDYIERNDGSGSALSMGASSVGDVQAEYEGYVQKFGKDNADYLMEVMGDWQKHYQRAVYIDTGLNDSNQVEDTARAEAARRGWIFERLQGDLGLVRRLLSGDWQDDFLVLQPGQRVRMSVESDIITAE